MSSTYGGRLVSNFVALTIIQGTNFLLPILVMPHVIEKIGAEGFGMVSIAHAVMIYLSTVSDYGFNLTATRDVALHKSDSDRMSSLFYLVLTSKMLITIMAFVALILLSLFVPFLQQHFLLYLFGFVYVIGQSLLVSWFFQGMEKMQYITIVTLVARLIFVLLVFLFINTRKDHVYFLFFLGIGNIIAGIFSIYLAVRIFKLRFIAPTKGQILNELKEGWHITVSNLSINTYLYTNVLILRIFTNDLIVGYYSIAERIFFAIRQVLGIFSQVIYPRVCQLAIRSKEQLPIFFKNIYLNFLAGLAILCAGIYIFAPWIVQIFISSKPDLAVLILRILSFVPIIVCLNIPAFQILLVFNKKKSYSSILAIGTIVNIAANLVLCNALGAVGTAISIIITELFITIGLNAQLVRNKLVYYLSGREHE